MQMITPIEPASNARNPRYQWRQCLFHYTSTYYHRYSSLDRKLKSFDCSPENMDSFPGVSLSSPLDVDRRTDTPQSLSSSMSGIAAVAIRIQERANELHSQLALASLAESELEQEQEKLDVQEKENASVRRTMLSAVQSRHSIELELWHAKDDASLLNSKTEGIYEYTHDLKARTVALKDEWEEVAQNTYANHETETTLFQRRME
eukprot:scaffold69770_cov46-Attheya_sp.AAC.1